jgi:hypothetical protein
VRPPPHPLQRHRHRAPPRRPGPFPAPPRPAPPRPAPPRSPSCSADLRRATAFEISGRGGRATPASCECVCIRVEEAVLRRRVRIKGPRTPCAAPLSTSTAAPRAYACSPTPAPAPTSPRGLTDPPSRALYCAWAAHDHDGCKAGSSVTTAPRGLTDPPSRARHARPLCIRVDVLRCRREAWPACAGAGPGCARGIHAL